MKRKMLNLVIEKATWMDDYIFACQQGCTSCCTQSVTMTTLEGEGIYAYLEETGRDCGQIIERMLAQRQDMNSPQVTTNQFAQFCLEGREVDISVNNGASWNFSPCQFLENGDCSIYPVRPFACRALVSQKVCAQGGAAEMAPVVVTLNTIWLQIIEHVDQGGFWGNMLDVLAFLQNTHSGRTAEPLAGKTTRLLKNLPVPGFLLPQ